MSFDQKYRPHEGPAPPGEGQQKQKYVQITRPNITEEIKKLEEAVQDKGGDPVARCVECKRRCEDCPIGCKKGFTWEDE